MVGITTWRVKESRYVTIKVIENAIDCDVKSKWHNLSKKKKNSDPWLILIFTYLSKFVQLVNDQSV